MSSPLSPLLGSVANCELKKWSESSAPSLVLNDNSVERLLHCEKGESLIDDFIVVTTNITLVGTEIFNLVNALVLLVEMTVWL